MIEGKKYNGLNVDIWSCGVILFAMVCGYLPFEVYLQSLYNNIHNGNLLYVIGSEYFNSLQENLGGRLYYPPVRVC